MQSMPAVTLNQCNPAGYGYLASQCPAGVSVVSPRPVEQRDTVINLIPITINIDSGIILASGGMAIAAWLINACVIAKPKADAEVDGHPTPLNEPELAKALMDAAKKQKQ
jgi:hypothetical protein